MSRSVEEIREDLSKISRKGDYEQDLVRELERAIEERAFTPGITDNGNSENIISLPGLSSQKPPAEPDAQQDLVKMPYSERDLSDSTMEAVVIDSDITLEEALSSKQELPAPKEVLERQRILDVEYYSLDGKLHRGQIVVDQDVAEDVKEAFELIKTTKFPVKSVIPMGSQFITDDEKSAAANNSCGFNYRKIAGTDKLSNHAFGRAIDINPWLNPYIREDYRQGGDYNPTSLGTITADNELVGYFRGKGWDWGGDWIDRKDYMHFEKPRAS